jgi:hypothetical protein
MFLLALGIIDLLASALIFLSIVKFSGFAAFVMVVGIIMAVKGLYSLGFSSYFAAFQDVGAGIILMLMSVQSFLNPIIPAIFGFLILIKAFQSILFHMIN